MEIWKLSFSWKFRIELITYLMLHQRCRYNIFLRFDFPRFLFSARTNHFSMNTLFRSFHWNVWPEVKGRNLPLRLNRGGTNNARLISLAFRDREIDSHGCPLKIHSVYIYTSVYTVKICRSTQQIATLDLWPRPATINLFTIYRFTPWGKQRAHTLHHNHDA